jgi:hypothetical protein
MQAPPLPPLHEHLDAFGAAAHASLELKQVHGGVFQPQGGVGGGAEPVQIWQSRQLLHVPQFAQLQLCGWQSQNGGCRVAHAGSASSDPFATVRCGSAAARNSTARAVSMLAVVRARACAGRIDLPLADGLRAAAFDGHAWARRGRAPNAVGRRADAIVRGALPLPGRPRRAVSRRHPIHCCP